ncbi:MAG: hypothetical protein DI565_04780 [Ancylobacter novellus]|uniref:DUF4304 domain-containing protein n=1 Tax=Ancylobacter novellus TaxID=921 RepID=A0A2W5MK82_ANCNO|nr:MAG: hypothetical protein DI565_04780 [Ancylobacter novellus]
MTDNDLQNEFKNIVAAAHLYLKQRGYSKDGTIFRKIVDNNHIIVQFQKSASNSPVHISFTVGLAVVSERLANAHEHERRTAFREADGHVRNRIGTFQAQPSDRWWTLSSTDRADAIIEELILLLSNGVDFFEKNASDEALIALWESGRSPGLTDIRRKMLLAELKVLLST